MTYCITFWVAELGRGYKIKQESKNSTTKNKKTKKT